ncbi:MAG TPA: hypothetical protein PK201_14430 [Accumulibacter sp.]|nr:hypothetical protein [Accumulibacter sp.]
MCKEIRQIILMSATFCCWWLRISIGIATAAGFRRIGIAAQSGGVRAL